MGKTYELERGDRIIINGIQGIVTDIRGDVVTVRTEDTFVLREGELLIVNDRAFVVDGEGELRKAYVDEE